MAWQVWWALVLGFAISAIVQAWVPRAPHRVGPGGGWPAAAPLGDRPRRGVVLVLLRRGRDREVALPEGRVGHLRAGLPVRLDEPRLGARARPVGADRLAVHPRPVRRRARDDRADGAALRLFVSPGSRDRAQHAQEADTGHQHHSAGEQLTWRERLTSASAWSDVAHNFRGDWQMLWKEITLGFLLAGFIAPARRRLLQRALPRRTRPGRSQAVENVIVGPVIAMLWFVCSVGNVPLAAVLWSGGISFAGVMAFIFADLIVLPIIAPTASTTAGRSRCGSPR